MPNSKKDVCFFSRDIQHILINSNPSPSIKIAIYEMQSTDDEDDDDETDAIILDAQILDFWIWYHWLQRRSRNMFVF